MKHLFPSEFPFAGAFAFWMAAAAPGFLVQEGRYEAGMK